MLTFSYTITPSLKSELEKIEELRKKILVELLPRKQELQLRYEAGIDRALYAARLEQKKITRAGIAEELTYANNLKAEDSHEAKGYLEAYEWLNQKWFMNDETIKVVDIKKLFSYLPGRLNIDEKQIDNMLSFIQVNPEHPVVQAGLSVILSSGIIPSGQKNLKYSLLSAEPFIYKYGYDFRGLICIEEFVSSDMDHFKDLVMEAYRSRNLSSALEYYAQAVSIQAEVALKRLTSREFKGDLPASFYSLSERQKEILALFAKPGVKVTNKTVQKEFKISQITASRDLAKLHTLGLIFSAGKGRSVYYTNI